MKGFRQCEICGSNRWEIVYQGDIRDGAYGNFVANAIVAKCLNCSIERLEESFCPNENIYDTSEYRKKLQQDISINEYQKNDNQLQKYVFSIINKNILKNKIIADIGCAGGSFLDQISEITSKNIAIEPCELYKKPLLEKGYSVYSNFIDAESECAKEVDFAFSFHVIEHVRNPREFLENIRLLLKPNGKLLISTPNRRDILMNLLPDTFPSFFYRVVHRWYFDAQSLSECAIKSGFKIEKIQPIHRYGLSNILSWLRDGKPTGHKNFPQINSTIDKYWRDYLEKNEQSDCLFILLSLDKNI